MDALTAKRTPTPWHTASDESGYFRCIEKDDRLIARCPSSDSLKAEADAAFIVEAVNAHEELLEALQALGTYPGGYCFCHEGRDAGEVNAFGNAHTGECEDARQAIAKAEGRNVTDGPPSKEAK